MDLPQEVKGRVCSEFEIEKIIGISDDGKYQVQWAPAWVSKNRLVGCDHLIQEFLKQESENALKFQPEIQHRSPNLLDETDDSDTAIQQYQHLEQTEVRLKLEPEGVQYEASYSSIEEQDIENHETLQNEENDTILVVPPSSSGMNLAVQLDSDDRGTDAYEYPGYTNEALTPHSTEGNELESYVLFNENELSDENDNTIKRTSTIRHDEFHHRYMTKTSVKHYTCPHCNKDFSAKGNLKNHIRVKHMKEEAPKPYSCDVCDYSSSNKGHVKRHMLTHTGEKAYKCNYCDSRFKRNDDLQRHVRTVCKMVPTG